MDQITRPATSRKPAPEVRVKRLNLALQGGGSHGAFTWGVIDRLLEDGRIEIGGLVGTSAGAMNATVTAYGLMKGGPAGARAELERFWRSISDAARQGPLQPTPLDKMMSKGNMDFSPMWLFVDTLSKVMSPYEMNPMNLNPLKDVLTGLVDFAALRSNDKVKLFICATNVCNGRIHVFDNAHVTPDAVLASACLPFMFQAVEVDGEFYWDGGYIGNPPLFPLIYHTDIEDILIIQINPVNIPAPPRSAREILDRVNTLSFNSSLMRELRAVDFVTKLIDDGVIDPEKYQQVYGHPIKRTYIHTIDAEEVVSGLGVSSKLNADWDFLMYLFEIGRTKATEFLDRDFSSIGEKSSTDVATKFM